MRGWLNHAGAKAAAAAVAVFALGATAYAAYGYATEADLGAVTPLAGANVRSATPAISIDVSNAGSLGRYTLRVDGRDVTTKSSMTGGAIRLDGVRLADGRHTVSVRATGDGMFAGEPRPLMGLHRRHPRAAASDRGAPERLGARRTRSRSRATRSRACT